MTKEREALIKQLREGQTYDFSTGDLLDMSSIMDDAANMLEALAQTSDSVEHGLFVGMIAKHPGLAEEMAVPSNLS